MCRCFCLKQQHKQKNSAGGINRSAAFCPLPCGGQAPSGRFCSPYVYGSRAPSSYAVFSADTSSSYDLLNLHSTGNIEHSHLPAQHEPLGNDIQPVLSNLAETHYISSFLFLSMFFSEKPCWSALSFPHCPGKDVENSSVL